MQAWKTFFRYAAVAVAAVAAVTGCSLFANSSGTVPAGVDSQFHPIAIANGPTQITVTSGSSSTSSTTTSSPTESASTASTSATGATSPPTTASGSASATSASATSASASPSTSASTEPGLPVTVSHAGSASTDPFSVTDSTVSAAYSFDCTAAGDSGFKADLISGTPDSPGGDDQPIADITGTSGQGTMPGITAQDIPGSYFIEVQTATSCTWQVSVQNG